MNTNLRLGISTCPNDTFAFHALLNRLVDWRGIDFHVQLLDIQQLNDKLFHGEFDVAKASFHAALRLTDQTLVLPSGSALGFGVGPLLLAAEEGLSPESQAQLALCPGQHTTATLLYSLFYPSKTRVEQVAFSQIMPGLVNRQAQFGVCIHEGRFTWQQHGLALVEDLGTRWEKETGTPLPLGGLLASRALAPEVLSRIQQTIRDSLEFALTYPETALPSMRKYAQELDDDILMQHVELYVNQWTLDLGETGVEALKLLSKRAKLAGIIDPHMPEIGVFRQF
jgi:1,4-dihydroxy-6-naphthoate synthase